MSSVFVWVEGETESLNELMDGTLNISATLSSGLLLSVCHTLNKVNYCSFICVEEDLCHSELDLWINSSILFYYLMHEYLLHFIYMGLIWRLWWSIVWIIYRSSSSLIIKDSFLLNLPSISLILESFKMHSMIFLSHFNFADFAPIFSLPGLHTYCPIVAKCTHKFHMYFAWTDHLHFESTTVLLCCSFDRFMDFEAIGAEFTTNMHF